MEPNWLGKATAEAVGTFGLVFFGAGSIIMDHHLGDAGYGIVGIALAHAVVLAIVVSATMNISGGHINPAVTVAAWLTRKISRDLAAVYVVFQLVGAVLAATFLKALLPVASGDATQLGTPQVAADIDWLQATTIEVVLTFFLVFAIWGTAVSKRAPPGIAGFGIGLVLVFDILVGGPLTGASMNPARTLGPAVMSGTWTLHHVYWIGPILGAALAAALYEGVIDREPDEEENEPRGPEGDGAPAPATTPTDEQV